MAFMDYGTILKINGEVKNLNQNLFMDMKEVLGFTIDPVHYKYEWRGQVFDEQHVIDGSYFVYFGDEEVCLCVYKYRIDVVINKKHIESVQFEYDENKIVKYYKLNGANIKIKKIDDGKIHAKIQYKGTRYEVIYGYGIDNNMNTFKRISKKRQYGYNKRNTRYIKNFLA